MAASLAEVLKDPNYQNANAATKQAIFDRYAPQDPNYANANSATQAAIRAKFGLQASEKEPDASAAQYGRVVSRAASPYAAAAALGGTLGSVVPGVGTVIGAGAGMGALALTDLASGVYNAGAGLVGGPRIPSGSEAIKSLYPASWQPQTTGQRIAESTTEGVTSALGVGGAAKAATNALADAGRTAPRVVNALGQNLGAQTVAGATAGTGVGVAREAGIENPLALTAIGMLAGTIPFGVSAVARGLHNVAEPHLPGGKENIKARAYFEALRKDPQLVQQAADLINQGYAPEQVASILQSRGFASLLSTSRRANTDVADIYGERERTQFGPVATSLSAATGGLEQGALGVEAIAAERAAALRAQQQQALLGQRSQQAGQLIGSRRTEQQQVVGARRNALQEMSAAEQAAAAQRQAAEAARVQAEQRLLQERQGVAAAVPETSQLKVGQTVTERRAAEMSARQGQVVTPAYEASFKLAPNEFEVPSTIKTATEIQSGTGAQLDPSLAPETAETLRVFGSVDETRLNPLTGENYTVSVPRKVTLRDADALIRAINRDYAALSRSTDPGARTALGNLSKLKASVEADIRNGVPEEAAAAYKNARNVARTQVIEPFLKGWLANLQREGSTGVQIQAPESVVSRILAGEDEASRFTLALGHDQQAMQAVKAGILDAYRNEVVRDGVIRPAAHDAFMSNAKYGRALEALDRSGMNIRDELNAFGQRAKELQGQTKDVKGQYGKQVQGINNDLQAAQQRARDAAAEAISAAKETGATQRAAIRETGATQRAGISEGFRTRLNELENQYKPQAADLRAASAEADRLLGQLKQRRITPDQSQANLERLTKSAPELKQAVEEARVLLEQEADFRGLAKEGETAGGGVRALASETVGKPVAPWIKGLQTSVINFFMARLVGKLDSKLAAEVAMEVLNSSKFAGILEKIAASPGKFNKAPVTRPKPIGLAITSANTANNALAPERKRNNALSEP